MISASKNTIVGSDLDHLEASMKSEFASLEKTSVLITGGSGFLGRYMVAALLRLGCSVVNIDNYITASRKNYIFDESNPSYRCIEHDISQSLPENIKTDYIIHAAGLASPFYYGKYPIETIETAVQGTKILLEYARSHPVKSIVFFSSSEIYGDPPPQLIPTPETYWGNISCLGPRACYDESKRLGETLCSVYHTLYNIPVKIIRPFNVYGPGGLADQDFRVIPTFITRALSGQKMPVHGKGNQTRTFCYITDAIIGFLKVLLHGRNGEPYNIGHDQDEINMMSLAHMVSTMIGTSSAELIDYPPTYPAGEPQCRCPDLSKARDELGFTPSIRLSDGLRRTIDWYRMIKTPSE